MSDFVVKVAQMVRINDRYYAFDRSTASQYSYWCQTGINSGNVVLYRTKVSLREHLAVDYQTIYGALQRQRKIRQYEPLRKREEIRYGLPC